MPRLLLLVSALLAFVSQQPPAPQAPSPIPATHLQTRWAAQVSPDTVLPEYPRPQMVRKQLDESERHVDVRDHRRRSAGRPASFDAEILVPFPIESQLSGAGVWVVAGAAALVPAHVHDAAGCEPARLLLNFGAVDWEAVVFVNGDGSRRASRRLRPVHVRHHRRAAARRRRAGARRRGAGSDRRRASSRAASRC